MNPNNKYSDVFGVKYSNSLTEYVYHGLIYYTDVGLWDIYEKS